MQSEKALRVKRYIPIHILCWGIIIFFPLVFFNPSDGGHEMFNHFVRSLGGTIAYISMFYINYIKLVPNLLMKGKARKFYLVNICLIAISVAFMATWWSVLSQQFPTRYGNDGPEPELSAQAPDSLGRFAPPMHDSLDIMAQKTDSVVAPSDAQARENIGAQAPDRKPGFKPDDNGAYHHRDGRHRGIFWPMYFQFLLSIALIIAMSMALRYSQRWDEIEDAKREAEKTRAEADLKNLRNQLNPHFLLNTLNNIYALIAFDSDKAQHAVEDLSKLLRHALYDNQQDRVPLYKEVAFMRNYIALMRIRVTDNVEITTDIDIAQDDSTPIAPLIFISLIENAFKHGISPTEGGYIHVVMSQHDGLITCDIRNSNHPKTATDKSGNGIGLEQVGKRLELSYPGRHEWLHGVSDDGSEYYSCIKIQSK